MASNDHIGKVLFVCSRNRFRSLTAEKMFEGCELYEARSAGTQEDARIVVTEGHIGWADVIFCMEKGHVNKLRMKYPEAMEGKRVVCLNIPDEYGYMEADLVEELEGALGPYLIMPGRGGELHLYLEDHGRCTGPGRRPGLQGHPEAATKHPVPLRGPGVC